VKEMFISVLFVFFTKIHVFNPQIFIFKINKTTKLETTLFDYIDNFILF